MTRLNLGLTRGLAAIYLFFSSAPVLPVSAAAERRTAAATSAAPAPTPLRTAGRPFLWKVEGPRPSWLFGTIHSADPTVARLPASVTTALDTSRSFHPEVELSADLAPTLALKLFAADTPGLSTRLTPALWGRVQRAGAELGLPDLLLERLTPGLAALFFSSPTDTDVAATVDGQLQARATARRLAITPLETLDEQLGLFAQLPEAIAITALTEALTEAESGRPNEKKLLRAYASGDERRVLAAIDAEFSASPGARALADPLLYRRNRLMADRVAPHLTQGGAFVAVGAAHLLGPKSIIELLRARGVRITRVP
jgi:Uncharacterized protein conserved in bacteria